MTIPKNKKLYLEQSVIARFFEKDKSLSESDVGRTLIELQSENKISIWISPQNVIELSLWGDQDKRFESCKFLEQLIDGKRMFPSNEFVLVRELMHLVESHWPESNVNRELLDNIQTTNQITYSGLLAHMGSIKDYDTSGAYEALIKLKLLSQLMQIEYLVNPTKNIDALLEGGEKARQFLERFGIENDHLSLSELKEKILSQKASLRGLKRNQKTAQKLEKRYAEVVKIYYKYFILPDMYVVLNHFDERIKIFDYEHIIINWNLPFRHKPDFDIIVPLPEELVKRAESHTLEYYDYDSIFEKLVDRYFNLLYIPKLMLSVAMKEIAKALKQNEPPAGGLTFDIDHSAMLYLCDIFFSYDEKLCATIKTFLKDTKFAEGHEKYCVESLSQIRRIFE